MRSQPASTPSSAAPPRIHLNRLHGVDELNRLDAACREWGFFQLADHGLTVEDRERALGAFRQFFQQPLRAKRAIERSATNPWGFYDRELTKNTLDWKQILDIGDAEAEGPLAGCEPQWPSNLHGFRSTIEQHRRHCERLASTLLQAIARALNTPTPALAAAFEPTHTSFLRLNYYPPCPVPEAPAHLDVARAGHLGINHHTDAGALTVLMQDQVNSLQVYQRGRWHTIEPEPDCLIINVGDVVQVWSNDRYQAPLHRVLANQQTERFSAAYFYNPAADAHYAPLTGLGTPRYRPISWGDFRNARAAGDYADTGQEIQIEHFRCADRDHPPEAPLTG